MHFRNMLSLFIGRIPPVTQQVRLMEVPGAVPDAVPDPKWPFYTMAFSLYFALTKHPDTTLTALSARHA